MEVMIDIHVWRRDDGSIGVWNLRLGKELCQEYAVAADYLTERGFTNAGQLLRLLVQESTNGRKAE